MTKNKTLDLIKIFGALAVILNHALYPLFSRADFFLGKSWWVATFIYSASTVAVPLFIITNGFLLLAKKEPIHKTYSRIWYRLVIPLLFWFVFFIIWRTKFYIHTYSVSELLGIVFSGNLFYYYYLVVLIGLQMLLPIWRLIITSKNSFIIKLVGFGTLAAGLLAYIARYSGASPDSGVSLVSWWLPFAFYYWWGYWRTRFTLPATKYWILAASSVYTLMIYLSHMGIKAATLDISLLRENGVFYWHSLVSLPVLILSICVFEAFMRSSIVNKIVLKKWVTKAIDFFAPLTYGVYLTHIFVIEWIDMRFRFAIEFIGSSTSSFLVTRTILVVLISFTVSWVITKTPIVKKVVGN